MDHPRCWTVHVNIFERISGLKLLIVEDALRGSTFYWTWSSTLNWRKKQSVRVSSWVPRSPKRLLLKFTEENPKAKLEKLDNMSSVVRRKKRSCFPDPLKNPTSLMAKKTSLLGFYKAISGFQQIIGEYWGKRVIGLVFWINGLNGKPVKNSRVNG